MDVHRKPRGVCGGLEKHRGTHWGTEHSGMVLASPPPPLAPTTTTTTAWQGRARRCMGVGVWVLLRSYMHRRRGHEGREGVGKRMVKKFLFPGVWALLQRAWRKGRYQKALSLLLTESLRCEWMRMKKDEKNSYSWVSVLFLKGYRGREGIRRHYYSLYLRLCGVGSEWGWKRGVKTVS